MGSDSSFSVKIMEECEIPVGLGSSSDSGLDSDSDPEGKSLPLTFLDLPWLKFPPSQPIFFFKHPLPNHIHTSYPHQFFSDCLLPRLKHSLSFALRCFFPFAGKLVYSHDSLFFTTNSSTSVPLTVAESDADFNYLCTTQSHSINADVFHQLVPHDLRLPTTISHLSLSPSPSPSTSPFTLFSIQITYFPQEAAVAAFSIGIAYHHVVSDQRTFNNFIRSWASFCKFGHIPDGLQPTFDRSVIVEPIGLRSILLKQWQESSNPTHDIKLLGIVRATFVMGPTDIINTRKWIQAQCDQNNRPYPVLLSPYVLTCAFVWSCFVRAKHHQGLVAKGFMYLGFIAGGITRLPYPVPCNYFGNCVAFGRAVAKREDLLREDDGILAAAEVIAQTIKDLDTHVLEGADKWIPDWEPIIGSDLHMNVVGSPKVDLYKTDFGWGTPIKIEEISIDLMRGISLMESRDMKGGIEIGLTQQNSFMDTFSSLFFQGLISIASIH